MTIGQYEYSIRNCPLNAIQLLPTPSKLALRQGDALKALSVRQPFASVIAYGEKTIEFRTWKTDYRGPLLICASKYLYKDKGETYPYGVAIATVQLTKIEPFGRRHLRKAFMDGMPDKPGFAWHLAEAQEIEPFKVTGKLHLYEVDQPVKPIAKTGELDHFDFFRQLIAID